jgi:hypothetical protein
MITITEIRRCQNVLAQTPIGEWAKTFVELRMNFYREYQHPFVFSTRFGADFFDELRKAFEHNHMDIVKLIEADYRFDPSNIPLCLPKERNVQRITDLVMDRYKEK